MIWINRRIISIVSMHSCSIPCEGKPSHWFLCPSLGWHCRRCWCAYMPVVELGHLSAFLLPQGKGSTVSLLPTLGGWARRARWWCRARHTQAWTRRILTFAFADRCRDRKDLLFHMLALVPTLSSAPHSLNQMAPWTLFTLGDGPRCRACPSASSFRPFGFLIPLHSLLLSSAGRSFFNPCRFHYPSHKLYNQMPLGHSLVIFFFVFCFLITCWLVREQIVSHQPQKYSFSLTSPSPFVFFGFVCVDIWELPYGSLTRIKKQAYRCCKRRGPDAVSYPIQRASTTCRPDKLNLTFTVVLPKIPGQVEGCVRRFSSIPNDSW